MSELTFRIDDAQPVAHAASPTIRFRLHVACEGEAVDALVLRVQIRLEPAAMRPLPWADVPLVVPQFTGETDSDLDVPCTYDFDVTATRFFSAHSQGAIPIRAFFSGTMFRRSPAGFAAEPVSWSAECAFTLPLAVWHCAMEACYGNSALIRIRRDTFEHLQRIREQTGATDWDSIVVSA
jgi:hypothetical protein